MDIAFRAPVALIVILCAAAVAVVLAVTLKRMALWRKVLGCVVALAACGLVLFLVLGRMHLVVDDTGIHAGRNGSQTIAWAAVDKAVLVRDLATSTWAPVRKTTGTSLGSFKSGWFLLADGSVGFLMVDTAGRALVVKGSGKTLVLAPRELDALAAEVAKHVPVEKEGGAS